MPVWLELIPAVSKLLDKLIPDPQAKANALLELKKEENAMYLQELQLAAQGDANQADINKIEAASPELYVAGWRPFIGWVCGVAFAYHYVAEPFLMFLISCYRGVCTSPNFDMATLSTVLMGMLGLGGLRTIEKIKSV